MFKIKHLLCILAILVTGCASPTASQRDGEIATRASDEADIDLQQKLSELDSYTLETGALTPVDVAFAKEMEDQTLQAFDQGLVRMTSDQNQLATAMLQKAEDLEPTVLVQVRIAEIQAVAEFLRSAEEEQELEGLNYKLRARRGYSAAVGENVLLESFSLDQPVTEALCRGLLICEE